MFRPGQKIYYIYQQKKVYGTFSHITPDPIDKWKVWANWSGGWSSEVRLTWMPIHMVFSDEPSTEDDLEYSNLFI